MRIRPFDIADEAAVIRLWEACDLTRSWNDPAKDIARKLLVQPEMFLVGEIEENGKPNIIATVMAGYEGHRGWINYLGVAPQHQKNRHARTIMLEAERLLAEAGCPKINLQIRNTNAAAMEFYRALGYQVDEAVSMGKRLEADGPAQ